MKKLGLISAFFLTTFLFLTIPAVSSAAIQLAITVDDLPSHGPLPLEQNRSDIAQAILTALHKHHISGVYGFINASRSEKSKNVEPVFEQWIKEGHFLGNHTFSHMPLYEHSSSEYTADIQKNEPTLMKWMGNKDFHWFRYPYLAEGDTKKKRDEVRTYLSKNHYKIAQVSTDFNDWKWQEPYIRCLTKNDHFSIERLKKAYTSSAVSTLVSDAQFANQLFNRDVKHILLIHIGAFTALMLDDLLTAYERLKVQFISLKDATSDPVYEINPNSIAQYSGTFLSQIGRSRKIEYPAIPEPDLTLFCPDSAALAR